MIKIDEKPEEQPKLVKAHLKCISYRKDLYEQLFFSELIVMVIEGYLDFVISFFLQVYSDQQDQWFYWLSILVGFFLYLLIPIFVIWVARKPQEVLESDGFKQRYGAMYS